MCRLAIVLPAKGSVEKYAVAELRRFVFKIGRTFGIVQYDKENSLKVIDKDLCKTVGGLSLGQHRLDTPRVKEVSAMCKGPCMVNCGHCCRKFKIRLA